MRGSVRCLGWKIALITTAVIEIGIRIAAGLDAPGFTGPAGLPSHAGPFAYWLSWAVGAHLADCHLNKKKHCWNRIPVWLFPAVWIAGPLVFPLLGSFGFLFAALATTVVIARFLNLEPETKESPGFLLAHLRTLGMVSYSFYLLHQPLLNAVPLLVKRFAPNWTPHELTLYFICLLSYPVIYLVSRASFRWTEHPAIAAGRRAVKSLRKKSPPADSSLAPSQTW